VLTLLGLVLAIGLVVDDAIVVLENVHRRIEEGEHPLLGSLRGSREIAFAVIATRSCWSPCSCRCPSWAATPAGCSPSSASRWRPPFMFSGLIALTLTPMMCSKLLRAHEGESRLVRWTEPFFLGMNWVLRVTLQRALAARVLTLGAMGVVCALAVALFQILPKEFAPIEDRGTIIIPSTGPEGARLRLHARTGLQIERIVQPYVDRGEVSSLFATIGGFQRPAQGNVANVFMRLSPWAERSRKQQAIAAR
jgi:multidrug efflux pump